MAGREDTTPDEERGRCDFCQSPLSKGSTSYVHDGTEYTFCTTACRDAMRESDRVFTTYRAHRWFRPEVTALEAKLPQGVPRNSFVLLSSQPGTRDSELQAELVWRTLNRDEPVIVVSFQEPPISLIERFLTLDWNVLPYLESGDLHLLDCFSYRVEDRDRMLDRMNDWSRHLYEIARPEITAVEDPTDVRAVESRLDACTSAKGMVDRGVVAVDSLTEFGSLVQPVQAYDFVKDVRADICKGRFVPVFAGAAYTGDADQFPHDLEYMFDGIVDMELNPELVEDALIKRMRVRKMSGALSYPEWTAYEFTSDEGLVMFDPEAEMEKTAEETATGSEEEDADRPDDSDGASDSAGSEST